MINRIISREGKFLSPAYLNLTEGQLKDRVDLAKAIFSPCYACPRVCKAMRVDGEIGECGVGRFAIVSSYGPHFGEEPVLVGRYGSGTVFFAGCNLRCVYCQNYEISQLRMGREVAPKELAEIFLKIQRMGCHNLNLVTPSHVVTQILEALFLAREKGFHLPLVYNTSSYDSLKTLRILDGVVDIYMPDIKYASDEIAFKYSGIKNYTKVAKKAIREMHRQVGDLRIAEGVALRGLLVRHLVLPKDISGSKEVLKFIASISKESYVNIMDQYYPTYRAEEYPELNRRVNKREYLEVVEEAKNLGLHRGIPFDYL